MPCEIIAVPEFSTQIKRLAKKYHLIKNDLLTLSKTLKNDPKAGIHLFGRCYKIRLSNSSIPTGKSGGFRVIYYYLDDANRIFLLDIYSKTERSTISDEVIRAILIKNGIGEQ